MTDKSEKTSYIYKLFRVKRSDGRITTVSMDPALVMQAVRALGDVKPVAKHVRKAAYEYVDGEGAKNCSAHVQAQLLSVVASIRNRSAGPPETPSDFKELAQAQ
jgi:hypothetical protein